MVLEKVCSKCRESKALGDFGKSGWYQGRQRYRAECSDCERATNRMRNSVRRKDPEYRARQLTLQAEWRTKNREAARQHTREWANRNPDRVAAKWSRQRAIRARAPHEPYSRADIFAAYAGTCAYCDAPAEHIDHVMPISKGGADAAHNLLPACAPCNLSKSAKTLAEWALTFA